VRSTERAFHGCRTNCGSAIHWLPPRLLRASQAARQALQPRHSVVRAGYEGSERHEQLPESEGIPGSRGPWQKRMGAPTLIEMRVRMEERFGSVIVVA
jgi:hypothetical protein